jgi:hypothetical protein
VIPSWNPEKEKHGHVKVNICKDKTTKQNQEIQIKIK